MEQVSIQNLLVSIPSRASNIAMTCVGQLLEEQMQNPVRMAKNIKRIGCVVSDWGLALTGEMNESGDAGTFFSGRDKKKLNPPLLNLPLQIRCKIWSYLDKDIKNLRLVCSKTQFDIDVLVGLPVIMDTSCDSMKWLQRVTTRSCFVTRLDNFLYFNFLPQPERMEKIRFHRSIYIPAEMLDLILRKFPSLRHVTFCSQELYEVVNGKEIKLIIPSINTELFSILDQWGTLFGLSLKSLDRNMTEWNLELKSIGFPNGSRTLVQPQLGQVHLEIPRHQISQQKDCIRLLDRQNKLFEIRSDLQGIRWEDYVVTISQNAKTLTGLHLFHLERNDTPFDCEILKDCLNLRFLSISADTSTETSEKFPYLSLVGLEWLSSGNLRTLTLEDISITDEDLLFVNQYLKKTVWVWMKRCLCGNERYVDLKLGYTSYPKNTRAVSGGLHSGNGDWESETESEDDFEEEMSHFYYGHSEQARRGCASIVISQVIRGIPVEVMKGILLTTWIAMC